MSDIIRDTLTRIGVDLQNETKSTLKANGSYRTGALYNSIEVTVEPYQEEYILKTGMLFYGEFLEFGTRKMRPKPFIAPSIERVLVTGGLQAISEAGGQAAVEMVFNKLDKVTIKN